LVTRVVRGPCSKARVAGGRVQGRAPGGCGQSPTSAATRRVPFNDSRVIAAPSEGEPARALVNASVGKIRELDMDDVRKKIAEAQAEKEGSS
jgi:hypothetical protein